MPRKLIHADALVDHRGVLASPGAILLEDHTILGVGTPQEIGSLEDAKITYVHGTVTPSFVNTHAHLDLSGVGIVSAKKSLIEWVEEVVFPIRRDTSAIETAVARGIELSIAGGTSIVGDISGSRTAADCVANTPLRVIPFFELVGLGSNQQSVIDSIQTLQKEYALQPHAPYSCGQEVYKAAFDSDRLIATHVAETKEELQFTMDGTGEFVAFLQRIGVSSESITPWNTHPIDGLLRIAGNRKWIGAHLNYIEERHLSMLAASNMTVAYCPRASVYFGHTDHRWKEMLKAGVQVALGTDSLLCLDTPERISVVDEMRFLYQQGDVDPWVLFAMATVNGASALEMDPTLVTLEVGPAAGLLAFETQFENPIRDIFESSGVPSWVDSLHSLA